ncbi:hypothetical protein, partial [Kitasatospora sp. NE20-6]|uniref:hypothetical protein n=1 Tax=Kitasatospora sp. NE20-6 TaxID=2859066 RepID=UPI0038B32A57
PVFTTPDGRVLAGSYRFDVNGVPKPDSWRPGRFTLQPARGAGASADLGSDLIEALQTRVPALLGGTAFPVGTDRGVPAPAELVRWMPKKKSKSGPASQATTPAQQTGSSAASGASPVQAAVSTVHDEDIWVSFGNPERFRQHIVSLELRSSRDPFSGLRIPRLVGGHQLDADGTIPVRDGDAVVRVTVPEGSRTEPLANGVFDATVEYRPLIGVPVTKLTTFYPAHLTWAQMKRSAAAAYRNAVLAGETNLSGGFHTASPGMDPLLGKFIGTDIHGNWLAGFVFAGEIQTAFPLNREPGTPRTSAPNPWTVAVTESTSVAPVALAVAESTSVAPVALAVTESTSVAPVAVAVTESTPVAPVTAEPGEVLPDIVWQPKPTAEQIEARVAQLWTTGLRALAARTVTTAGLAEQAGAALKRARRLPIGQQGSLVESLLTLQGVLAAEELASMVASGGHVDVSEVTSALEGLRKAVVAQLLLLDGDFQGHAGEVLRALAMVRKVGDDWTAQPWPARLGRWLAVLHSSVLATRGKKGSIPRGIYDQHLQTLATSGVELLRDGELGATELKASLDRLPQKSRQETEQRMWLSDIRYAVGSADGTTVAGAVKERLEYLAADQKRIDSGQGKNPAQRRGSGTDDRYTAWAQEIRKRIDAVHDDIEQLGTRAPAAAWELPGLRIDSHLLKIRKEVWLARELGYLPYKQALAFAILALALAKLTKEARGNLKTQAKEGFDAVRTITPLLHHSGDPEPEIFESTWQKVFFTLEEAELTFLSGQGGHPAGYAGTVSSVRRNLRSAAHVRYELAPPMVKKYLAEVAALEKEIEKKRDAATAVTEMMCDAARSDVGWAVMETYSKGIEFESVDSRMAAFTGEVSRGRIVMGVTSPYRMMLLLAQLGQLRHLAADPAGFVADLRKHALKMVQGVQHDMLTSSFDGLTLANVTAETPSAQLLALLETLANAWAELVHFGFASQASARQGMKQGEAFEQLADRYRMPDLGDQMAALLDLHLKAVSGPERPSDAQKWRDGILKDIRDLLKGWPKTPDSDTVLPFRYAGTVLDALVAAADRQTPPPDAGFRDSVRGARTGLQKLAAGTVYYPVEDQPFAPVPATPPLDVLSATEHEAVSSALDGLAAMVPLVLRGAIAATDFDAASLEAARMVARQSDLRLVLRAAVLAMLGDRPLDPHLVQRAVEALVAVNMAGRSPGARWDIDTDTLLQDVGPIIRDALDGTTLSHARFSSALVLAQSDSTWRNSGYARKTADQMEELLAEGDRQAVLKVLADRVVTLANAGTVAGGGGLVSPDLMRERLSEIPDVPVVLTPGDRRQLDSVIQYNVIYHRLDTASSSLLTEELFVDSLDELSGTVVLPKAEAADPAKAGLEMLRRRMPVLPSQLAINAELGGIDQLPRHAAVVALREEMAYRNAVAAGDGAEAVRRFGRWLGALEHAGLEAFGVAPGVVRSAFVRLLSVEVPEGFGER